jgi:hypothetical protein
MLEEEDQLRFSLDSQQKEGPETVVSDLERWKETV